MTGPLGSERRGFLGFHRFFHPSIGMALSGFVFWSACITFIPGVAVAAETENPYLSDRFMIRGGISYIFKADTIFGINSANGVTASADFSQLLGGDQKDEAWRVDSLYRFNPRHSLGVSYYSVDRKGDRELLQDITIDDITYSAGARMMSDIGVDLYRLYYNYSFVHDEKTELALSGGLYISTIQIKLKANFTCTGSPSCTSGPLAASSSTTTQTVPLPNFGFQINYNILPRLQAQGRLDWFYIESGSFQGGMTDFYAGLEYRPFNHFALGAAFDRFNVDVNYAPQKSSGWQVINNWNSLYLYGALFF